jgi:TolB-like protein
VRVYAIKTGSTSLASETHAPPPDKAGPPRLSIVVLPFANLCGDPEQEYFVDGVTESLTTDLSRIAGSFVIGRNTAYSYKRRHIDLKQVGRELNVRYVLEGSVQRSGNRLRINVQLIDAETGTHLWAERFDTPVADLFDCRTRSSRDLPVSWERLMVAEARCAKKVPHPDSMDLYFQGQACLNKGWITEHMTEARGFFERALTCDPGNIEALVGTAVVDYARCVAFVVDNRAPLLAAAEASLTKVLSVAPEHAFAHVCMGRVQIQTNRARQGIAECERALAPNIGQGNLFLGRAEETEDHILEALRLSPRDPIAYSWTALAGGAKLHLRKHEESVA